MTLATSTAVRSFYCCRRNAHVILSHQSSSSRTSPFFPSPRTDSLSTRRIWEIVSDHVHTLATPAYQERPKDMQQPQCGETNDCRPVKGILVAILMGATHANVRESSSTARAMIHGDPDNVARIDVDA